MILVSSAKGGVGKSSITINLAFALRRLNMNNRVGILDADVFGPSIPRMLNLEDKKADVDKRECPEGRASSIHLKKRLIAS